MQAYQIRAAPASTIAPSVVMASSPTLPSQGGTVEVTRKREVRLMKNRWEHQDGRLAFFTLLRRVPSEPCPSACLVCVPGRQLGSVAGRRRSTSSVWRTEWLFWRTRIKPSLRNSKHLKTCTVIRLSRDSSPIAPVVICLPVQNSAMCWPSGVNTTRFIRLLNAVNCQPWRMARVRRPEYVANA